jgi:hypothetical protein
MKIWIAVTGMAFLLLPGSVFPSIKDIHKENLPKSPIIDQAYEFVDSVEPMVQAWAPEWKYEESKDQIVQSFEAMLGDLRKLAKKEENRGNAELQLFIGLSAHYAYNVDVKDSYEIAVSSFQSAAKLLPKDYRPLWFKGEHLCQTAKPAEGMLNLLQVEKTYPFMDFPEDFWADYLSCSHLTLMPEHGLRALRRASETGHLQETTEKFFRDAIGMRLKATEADQNYPFKDVWVTTESGKAPTFLNSSIGLSFKIDGNWSLQFSDLKHGDSTTSIGLPKIAGFKQPMTPTLTIITKLAHPDESFDDFRESILKKFKYAPGSIDFCSRMNCEAYDVSAPFYPDEGGAHLFVIFMERSEPDFPGLIFEYPHAFPPGDHDASGPKYYHADASFTRLKGKIRYAIVLDSCVSIYPGAKKYFDSFLKNLVIE